MSIKAVLFDLDGTLLSMDQDFFIKTYLSSLAEYISDYGYDPKEFAKAIWISTDAMVKNDGKYTNEKVFWDTFSALFPLRDMKAEEVYFDKFYEEKFDLVGPIVSRVDNDAVEAVRTIRKMGLRTVLATNPLFPAIATRKRIGWAGLETDDFEFFTSYENSTFSKPSKDYYKEVLSRANLQAEECIMVGNDVSDDMVAEGLGMKVFLLTDHLINKEEKDISVYPNGSFKELLEYVSSLCS